MTLAQPSGAVEDYYKTAFSIEKFLYREARLLDEERFDEWHALFTDDGVYWIPINLEKEPSEASAIIYDTPRRLHERVHHLVRIPFPAQSPRSRTLHVVSNVEVMKVDQGLFTVASSQLIYELRRGDFRQVGLGELRVFPGRVEHQLVSDGDSFRISLKKIVLIERDVALRNMTTIY